jgi:hypothetical protein
MTDWRTGEAEQRAAAEADEVLPESGEVVTPRKMEQLLSVRLDGETIGELRKAADDAGTTVSRLVREVMYEWLETQRTEQCPRYRVEMNIYSWATQNMHRALGKVTWPSLCPEEPLEPERTVGRQSEVLIAP